MEVFFYGLFMDVNLLLKNGISPSNPRRGYLNDYELKIGDRASLIPCKNKKSYGIVMTIDNDAIRNLYSEPDVADYIPEEVNIITNTNKSITATCYNLPSDALSGTNELYAKSLYKLAKQEGFPESYLANIKKMIKPELL
jgi:AIG2 family protein